jgi:hypothetical protein
MAITKSTFYAQKDGNNQGKILNTPGRKITKTKLKVQRDGNYQMKI